MDCGGFPPSISSGGEVRRRVGGGEVRRRVSGGEVRRRVGGSKAGHGSGVRGEHL